MLEQKNIVGAPIAGETVIAVRRGGIQFFLALAGVVISGLNEAIHRARCLFDAGARADQESEEDRQHFFALSQDMLCILGFDGCFKDANEAWEKTLGYTRAEFLATPFIEFVHPDDREATRAMALTVSGGEALVTFENRYRCRDGSYRCFQWSLTQVFADHRMYGVARDITDRKRSEARLRRLMDSDAQGVMIWNTMGEITEANDAFLRIVGYTREDLEAGRMDWAKMTPPEFASLDRHSLEEIAATGVCTPFEKEFIHKDGSRVPVILGAATFGDSPDEGVCFVLDITARKQAEDVLLNAGALQNAIFNSANFSSIATDAKGVIQIFNVGAERMLGYTAADVMNKITPAEISDPQEVVARATALSEELETSITPGFEALVFKASRGIEDIYELTYIRKDGSRFPAVVSVTALRDTQDVIIGYLLIGTDNTARKQAEEALLKAGALQRAIFNSANFSSIATDAKGVIQIFNVGAERMLGYTADEVLNKITPAELSDPQEVIARAKALSLELGTTIAPGFEALVYKASRGIEDIYELTKLRKDGSRFPAVVSVTALRDAQDVIIGYLLIGTDNTARKQVEEERMKLDQRLRDQQFYTRSLIESNIDALMTTDPLGIITDVNKQMEALTACTRDELIGAPFKGFFTDPERAEAGIKQVLSEKKVTDYELTARARDGKETVVSYNATTFYDRERKLQGVCAAARDVTDWKRFEQTLREKNLELENASLAKDRFLASMSHELRTPLNAIIGFTGILLLRLPGPLTIEQEDQLLTIKSSAKHQVSLINDLLDLAKIESGKVELNLQPVDSCDVVGEVATTLRPLAESKGLTLDVNLPGVFSMVRTDRRALSQILINLTNNAIKFTDAGSVRIDLRRLNGAMDLTVEDTGIGIDPLDQARLFEAFARVENTGPEREEGTGLGLHLSQKLAGLLGGSITFTSQPGIGSAFTLSIPNC